MPGRRASPRRSQSLLAKLGIVGEPKVTAITRKDEPFVRGLG
jgi:hypothetical protein